MSNDIIQTSNGDRVVVQPARYTIELNAETARILVVMLSHSPLQDFRETGDVPNCAAGALQDHADPAPAMRSLASIASQIAERTV